MRKTTLLRVAFPRVCLGKHDLVSVVRNFLMDGFDEQEQSLYSRDVRNQAQDGTDAELLAMGLSQDNDDSFSLIVLHRILARIGGFPALSTAALRQIDAAIAAALPPTPPNTARAAPRVRAAHVNVVRAAKRIAQPEQPQGV